MTTPAARSHAVAFALALLTTACVTPASFPSQVSAATCDRLRECDEDLFDGVYDNRAECIDALTLDASCALEHCESFDAEAANECLKDIRDASCAGLDAPDLLGCATPYSDCDAVALAACVVTE